MQTERSWCPFLTATNKYLSGSSQRLADAEFIREYAGNTTELEARCDALTAEMNAIIEQTQTLISENASVAMDQKVYAERYSRLVADYDSKKAEFDNLQIEIAGKKAREVQIKHFIEAIRELGETVTEFENGLFGELVDFMTVYKDKTIKVTFKDGTEI